MNKSPRCERCPDEDTKVCRTCDPDKIIPKANVPIICPVCKCMNGADYNYCWYCGKKLVPEGTIIYCPNCNSNMNYNHSFKKYVCYTCGYKTDQPMNN